MSESLPDILGKGQPASVVCVGFAVKLSQVSSIFENRKSPRIKQTKVNREGEIACI
jgi:hypothetical protein